MKIIKKILYYRDVGLLWKVFFTSLKISFVSSVKKHQPPLFLSSFKKTSSIENPDIDKITKYVNLYTFIRGKLGFKETCLTYSLLLYHMLRQAGIGAKINFGAKKTDFQSRTGLNMIGHCWVTIGDEKKETNEQLIFNYP